MAVPITPRTLISALSTNWAETARENDRRSNQNDAALAAAVEDLQNKVPVQRVKQGSNTFTPDADGTVTLPSGVVLPAMTTAQRTALANPVVGQGIYNTSTAREETYTATGWQGPIQALTTTQRTALTPAEGELVVDTTEGRLYAYLAGTWTPVGSCIVDVFTASATWTKRSGARLVHVVVIGAGQGGQGNTNSCGGGAGGGRAAHLFPAAAVDASVPVTIAPGSAGSTTTTLNAVSAATFGSYLGVLGARQIGALSSVTDSETGGAATSATDGNSSAYGAGSGGGASSAGRPGGASGSLPGGALASTGQPPNNGRDRSGSGLGGSGGSGSYQYAPAGSGGIPGGGGGGCNGGGAVSPQGGPGARSEVIVITYF